MGAVVFIKELATYIEAKSKNQVYYLRQDVLDKYREIIDDNAWINLEHKFVKDFCRLQGLS